MPIPISNHRFSSSRTGLILAADVDDLERLQSLVVASLGSPAVVGIKVGFSLALRYGLPGVVSTIRSVSDVPIIYDHQKGCTDIPQMGGPFVRICKSASVDAAIFFPMSGPRTLEAFVAAARDNNLLPIVGLTMTHPGYLRADGGYITDQAPELICEACLKIGVTDFVLPGNKPAIVSQFSRGSLSTLSSAGIFMPGIGSQGGDLVSAFSAASPHRRFAIVGSAIYNSKDPSGVITTLTREIERAAQ